MQTKVKINRAIELLRDKNIPYEINSKGFIVYLLRNQAEVLGIIRDVKYNGVLSDNIFESEIMRSDNQKNKYISAFTENNIPYMLEPLFGELYLHWPQTYGPEVDIIVQKINIELRQELTKKAIKDGTIPSLFIDSMEKL